MTIGVFFGGKSPEHDVSIITGHLIIEGLAQLGIHAVPVYVTKEGEWELGDKLCSIEYFKKKHTTNTNNRWHIDLEKSRNGTLAFKEKKLWGKTIVLDIAFPAFHGAHGEDGAAQGFFEMAGIPYVGCGVAASAIAMDKVLTKLLYENAGFPTTKFIYFSKKDWEKNRADFLNKIKTGLTWPLFVKPARLGSSIGIGKADNEPDLERALDVAFHYDDKALVEEAVEPVMDITCAVLGNKEPQASLLQESVFSGGFFSYDDKYIVDGGAQTGNAEKSIVIPARVDSATTTIIQNLALQVYVKFELSGTARIDFLYNTATKKIYVNEINTLPGTLYHHLWEKSGLPLKELLQTLITLAKDREKEQKKLTHTFASRILEHADWSKKLRKK